MNQFLNWINQHALKACGFTAAFTFIAAAELDMDLRIGAALAMLLIMWIAIWIDLRANLIIFLGSLFVLPIQAQPVQPDLHPTKEQAIAVATVVVVIGGIAIYYLRGYCKKHFAPPPSANTNEVVDAACIRVAVDYCVDAAVDDYEPTFQISGSTDRRLAIQQMPSSSLIDRGMFAEALIDLGLNEDPGRYYAHAGHACSSAEANILIDDSGTIIVGQDPQRMILERSYDLISWQSILQIHIPITMEFRLYDSPQSSHAFYRLKYPL